MLEEPIKQDFHKQWLERKKIVEEIEKLRKSHLICYITSDRQNRVGSIAADGLRKIYDHLLETKKTDKSDRMDLFIYSRGGASDVPWPLVCAFREFCDEFNVLIPYRAHSAATAIALGADHIAMGPKGELGPIDASMRGPLAPIDELSKKRALVSVEDVRAYFSLAREMAKVREKKGKVKVLELIGKHVHPLILGAVHRQVKQSEYVADRLLNLSRAQFTKKQKKKIVKSLAGGISYHGHAISREEAQKIGLPIQKLSDELERYMWELYLEYEKALELTEPFNPEIEMNRQGVDQFTLKNSILAFVESTTMSDFFVQTIQFIRQRTLPQQVNINLSPRIQWPPQVDPSSPQHQCLVSEILARFKNLLGPKIAEEVQKQIIKQSKADRIVGKILSSGWERLTDIS